MNPKKLFNVLVLGGAIMALTALGCSGPESNPDSGSGNDSGRGGNDSGSTNQDAGPTPDAGSTTDAGLKGCTCGPSSDTWGTNPIDCWTTGNTASKVCCWLTPTGNCCCGSASGCCASGTSC